MGSDRYGFSCWGDEKWSRIDCGGDDHTSIWRYYKLLSCAFYMDQLYYMWVTFQKSCSRKGSRPQIQAACVAVAVAALVCWDKDLGTSPVFAKTSRGAELGSREVRGKEGMPIKRVLMSELLLLATGAQSCWGPSEKPWRPPQFTFVLLRHETAGLFVWVLTP